MSVMHFFQEKWFLTYQQRVGKKRLFLLSDQWMTVCDWKNGKFSDLGRFQQGDDEALAAFVALLQQNKKNCPAFLLVDVIEEELRREKIPPLRGADREDLLQRRLERLFPGTDLRRAVSQGMDKEGGEWILFSGLIHPTLVTPWLTALQRSQVPLAGIWSLQLLSRDLLRKVADRSENALLVGVHSGGLRQTFFHRGRTLISRLTPVAGRSVAALPELIRKEVDKSRGYLNSLRLLPTDGKIDLYILAQGDLLAALASWSQEKQGYQVHIVDAVALGVHIGLREGLHDRQLERLHAHLLLLQPQANHYLPTELLCYHKNKKLPAPATVEIQSRTDTVSEPQVSAVTSRPVRRLGDLLVEKGILTLDQLQTALTEQKRSSTPLGKVFIALGFLSESTMRDILAESLSQESIDLREVLPLPEVLKLVPKMFAQRHGVLPVLFNSEGCNRFRSKIAQYIDFQSKIIDMVAMAKTVQPVDFSWLRIKIWSETGCTQFRRTHFDRGYVQSLKRDCSRPTASDSGKYPVDRCDGQTHAGRRGRNQHGYRPFLRF